MYATGVSVRVNKVLTVLLALCLPVALANGQQKPPKPPPPPKPARTPQEKAVQQQVARAQAQEANQQARAAQLALSAPKIVQLAHMSPEERNAALAKLPPEKRAQLEQRLENYSKRTPEQQARDLSQLNRLESLPPEKQALARESLAEFLNAPGPRHVVIANEMTHMSAMTEEQRLNYMSKPAFRAKYSAQEIDLMNNLHGIVP